MYDRIRRRKLSCRKVIKIIYLEKRKEKEKNTFSSTTRLNRPFLSFTQLKILDISRDYQLKSSSSAN